MIIRTSLWNKQNERGWLRGHGNIYCFCSFGLTQLDKCTLASETENMRHRVVATAEMMRMI